MATAKQIAANQANSRKSTGPKSQNAEDIAEALSRVVGAIGDGQITPSEGESVANMLSLQTNVLESVGIEHRLQKLEAFFAEEDEIKKRPERI